MLLALVAILLATGAPSPGAAFAKAELRFDPMYAYLKLKPGEPGRQPYTVKNNGKRPVLVDLFRRDAWHDESGGRIFPEPGISPQGLVKWLEAPRVGRVRIPAGATVEVEEKLTVPSGTRPGTYLGALMIRIAGYENEAGEVESAESIRAGVRTNDVVALTLHVMVPPQDGSPPTPDVVATDHKLELPTESQPLVARVHLANRSVWEVKPVGTLAVFDAVGRPIGKAAFDSVMVWPGQAMWIAATFTQRLPPGGYRALAAFAMQDPGEQQTTFPSPPVQRKLDFQVGATPPATREPQPAGASPPLLPGKQGK